MKSLPTLNDLEQHMEAARAKFGDVKPMGYGGVTQTQLSIARHYGGCKVNGRDFSYNWEDDSLIRSDIQRWLIARMKRPEND
jgi:hypothetical protein